MQEQKLMNLKVLLPFQVFIDKNNISRIIAEGAEGSFGLLPRRRDCVVALVPGILVYENAHEGKKYIAIDEGVLIKTGQEVCVSVRNAFGGAVLSQLRQAVEREFLQLDEREINLRAALAKMESDLRRHLGNMQK